ncbi:MAG: hypothetical protein ABW277_11905 [Longimicrobiaceae bacterium]
MPGPVSRRGRLRRLALAVGLALLTAAPAGGQGRQGVSLPAPGGPHTLGTTLLHLVDSTRADLVDGARRREVMVQLWYPAARGGGERAPYMAGALVDTLRREGYYEVDSTTFAAWRRLRTHAREDAPPAAGPSFPVLLLSHGFGVSRSSYTALAEELASHGYAVAAVDHPYGGITLLPDGRVLSVAADTGDVRSEATLGSRVRQWAADASFVLDRLRAMDAAPAGRFAGRLDLARAGMLGHSLGGAAAVEACRTDPRFRACADLDGALYGPAGELGPGGPTLVVRSRPLYSDAELAARGRTRAGWDSLGAEIAGRFRVLFAKRPEVPAYHLQLAGTGHMSFSDAPFTFPVAVNRFGGRIIAPERGHRVLSAYLRAFFARHLGGGIGADGGDGGLLDAPSPRYPEVVFVK